MSDKRFVWLKKDAASIVSTLQARIAELEAANAICRTDIEALMTSCDRLEARNTELEAIVATYENPTHCKIDQHFPDKWPCPRCGEGPCRNAGTFNARTLSDPSGE